MTAITDQRPSVGTAAGPLSLLVVQATPFCNINCDYCYLPDRLSKHVMSEATLDALFERVFESPYVLDEGFTLVWHAGEPLVVPIDFYRKAPSILARHNRRRVPVATSFQTNATLIDDRWCEFFKEVDARIGVSLDGPRVLHDQHRKTRRGDGTYDRVMAGVACLQKHGIPFSVICVLTASSLEMPDAIYDFFVENGITDVGFNVEEMEGQAHPVSLSLDSCYAPFRRFFETLLERNRTGALRLREVRSFQSLLQRPAATGSTDQCRPMRIVTVDWQGGLSTFSPELHGITTSEYGKFTFGSVLDTRLVDMLTSPRFIAVNADISSGIAACERECSYFGVCGGGAPANKLFENGSFRSTETMYCRTRIKALTDVLLPRFEAALDATFEPRDQ